MTDKQPKALRLADQLERMSLSTPWDKKAAAELRRLHGVNAELVEALRVVIRGVPDTWDGVKQAKAILNKAKENNNG